MRTNGASYRRSWYSKRRQYCLSHLGAKCVSCGSVERLEFDHIDPTTKTAHITQIFHWPQVELMSELAKCQLLCRQCHIEKSRGEVKPTLHGTLSMYSNKGCRCAQCCAANAQYKHVYYVKKRAMQINLAVVR